MRIGACRSQQLIWHGNIVMVKRADGEVVFYVMYALLFGFGASVMHYLSWAAFQQAFARRLLGLV